MDNPVDLGPDILLTVSNGSWDIQNKNPMKKIQSLCIVLLCLISLHGNGQKPIITGFTPQRAAAGSNITITGSNFNTTAANNIVSFGAIRGSVVTASATSLTVTVPSGATFRPITVTNTASALTGSSIAWFAPSFSGGFKSPQQSTTSVTNTFNYYAYKVVAGDLDNDGKADLITPSGSNYFGYHRNLSTATNVSFSTWNVVLLNSSNFAQSSQIVDIDGDGKKDVYTLTNNTSSQFAAWTIVGARNTTTASTITFGSTLSSVSLSSQLRSSFAVGDLDVDGKIDATALAPSTGRLLIVRNNSTSGTITLAGSTFYTLPTGFSPREHAIADFDADGKPDVVVSGINAGVNQVILLRNTSGAAGTFSFAVDATITLPAAPAGTIAIGDFNNDGSMDFALTATGKRLLIYPNSSSTGALSFGSPTSIIITKGSTEYDVVTAGELNGDGYVDITVCQSNVSSAVTFFNKAVSSSIGFDEVAQTESVTNSAGPEIADINGDGKNELIFASNPAINIVYNAPPQPVVITSVAPRFGEPGSEVIITGTSFNPLAANNLVFFGPSKAVVTQASATSLTVTVPYGAAYENITVFNTDTRYIANSPYAFQPTLSDCGTFNDSSFAQRSELTTPGALSTRSPVFFDINGDSRPELLVADRNSNNILIFPNNSATGNISSASFGTPIILTTGSEPYNIAVGDLTGDGKPEIVVSNFGSNTISIFRNLYTSGSISNSSFSVKTDIVSGSSASSNPTGVAIGDIDSDGRFDIVVSNRTDNLISVLLNTITAGSSNPFTFSKTDLVTGTLPISLALADIDGDRKPEIITANYSSNSISVFYNKSTVGVSSFNTKIDFTTGTNPNSIAAGDLNQDGKTDLVVTNNNSNSVSVFKNNMTTTGAITSGSFAAAFSMPVAPAPSKVILSDVSGEGVPDLIVSSIGSASLSVSINNSSVSSMSISTFGGLRYFDSGFDPSGIAAADLDLDGRADLAISRGSDALVTILQGRNLTYPGIATQTSSGVPQTCFTGPWIKYFDQANGNKILFSIKDAYYNFYGNISSSVYVDNSPVQVGGKYLLQRHFAISTDEQPYGLIQLRLYFTDAEFAALRQADPTITAVTDLYVTKYDGPTVDGTLNFGDATSLKTILPNEILTGREYGSYFLEFTIESFSEFWIHSQNAILPLKLIAFKAEKTNSSVMLNWTTAEEINASHFEIEKSTNGLQYKMIGKLPSASSSALLNHYTFTDPQLPSPLSYYRLKQVDKDGSFVFSKVLAVSSDGVALNVRVSPNPVSGSATLHIEGSLKDAEFSLFTASGKLVYNRKLGNINGSGALSINRAAWSNGMYYYTVTSANAPVQKGKIIYK